MALSYEPFICTILLLFLFSYVTILARAPQSRAAQEAARVQAAQIAEQQRVAARMQVSCRDSLRGFERREWKHYNFRSGYVARPDGLCGGETVAANISSRRQIHNTVTRRARTLALSRAQSSFPMWSSFCLSNPQPPDAARAKVRAAAPAAGGRRGTDARRSAGGRASARGGLHSHRNDVGRHAPARCRVRVFCELQMPRITAFDFIHRDSVWKEMPAYLVLDLHALS